MPKEPDTRKKNIQINFLHIIITNGYIRDIEVIQNIDIGVYAVNSYPKKTDKSQGTGEKDVPIKIGNVSIESGCWIYVDTNGWVVANKELKF